MFHKKPIDPKQIDRLGNVIQTRLQDEYSLNPKALAEFANWMAEDLEQVLDRYGDYVTVVSRHGSIGR